MWLFFGSLKSWLCRMSHSWKCWLPSNQGKRSIEINLFPHYIKFRTHSMREIFALMEAINLHQTLKLQCIAHWFYHALEIPATDSQNREIEACIDCRQCFSCDDGTANMANSTCDWLVFTQGMSLFFTSLPLHTVISAFFVVGIPAQCRQ